MKWGLGDHLPQLKPFPFFFSENNGVSGEDTIKEQGGKDVYPQLPIGLGSMEVGEMGCGSGVTRGVEVETGAIVAVVEELMIEAAYVPT